MDTATGEDIIDVLIAQHERINELFLATEAAKGGEKERVFLDLVSLLTAHERGEQAVVHPTLRAAGDDAVTDARVGEEEQVDAQLHYLVTLGVDGPGFDIKFGSVHIMVRQHAANEEQIEFPRLRELFTSEQRAGLAEKFRSISAAGSGAPS